jgi:cytochrome c2
MSCTHALAGGLAILVAAPALLAQEADARRGAEFFDGQKCNTCHASNSARKAGSSTAPDLTKTLDRDYTPSGIAARMWNHAPAMWSAISKSGMAMPQVSEQQAGDLFAFLYSARYFDKPGDAGRGRRAFSEKHCAECHAIQGASKATTGPPVAQWRAVSDPVALVDQMWNHVPQMKAEFAKRNLKWPELTSQDLTDMLVYLRNLPESKGAKSDFQVPASENGKQLFGEKGCTECHKGALALDRRLQNRTLTEIAASLWNHSPKMKQPASQISYAEMKQILGYLWSQQFFNPNGDPARGKRVFETKRCSGCHNTPPGVGSLPAMVAALWKHGPQMLGTMEKKGVDWPILTAPEVSSLVAYMAKK